MADVALGQHRAVALRQAVAPVPHLLDVRGADHQRVALEPAGREPHPGVLGVGRGVRPPVHPDDAVLLEVADALVDGDNLLGLEVAFLPDAQLQRSAQDVG